MPKKLPTDSWSVRSALSSRKPFTTYGNLRAADGGRGDTGRLPEPYRSQYRDAWWDNKISYTVYSYRTPIAWVLDDGSVIVPPVRYSRTTTRHQGYLHALGRSTDVPAPVPALRERGRGRTGTALVAPAPVARRDFDPADADRRVDGAVA